MIKLSYKKFQNIPEGEAVLKIIGVNYDKTFGKLTISFKNPAGLTHDETFRLKNDKGETNEKAIGAFSYFARTAMNDFELQEINEEDLVDHYVKCTVKHNVQTNRNDPSKTVTFVNLSDYKVAIGFENTGVDLSDLD